MERAQQNREKRRRIENRKKTDEKRREEKRREEKRRGEAQKNSSVGKAWWRSLRSSALRRILQAQMPAHLSRTSRNLNRGSIGALKGLYSGSKGALWGKII